MTGSTDDPAVEPTPGIRALFADVQSGMATRPGDGARRVLAAVFPASAPVAREPPLPLAPFQADAVTRVLRILDVRGGALLADSVGLGKTHIALGVISESMGRGCASVLAVTPAALRRQWVGPLRRLARTAGAGFAAPSVEATARGGRLIRWTSHARLSRGERPSEPASLVVVDEAHAFRNPRTRRYRELARLCAGARVLLVTATPVNNSLSDLYFLLRLFLGDGGLEDLGVADLRAFLRPSRRNGAPIAGRSAVAAITVRRTRRHVESEAGGTGLRFPLHHSCTPVPYDPAAGLEPSGFDRLVEHIAGLRLDVHDVLRGPGRGGSHLVRASLLKRLESSEAAFERSVGRLDAFLRACAAGIPFGRIPAGRELGEDPDQISLGPLLRGAIPDAVDRDRLLASVAADLSRVVRIRAALRSRAGPDPKLRALRDLLAGPLAGRSVLVFTEFADTARAVHRDLAATWPTGLVTGREALLGAGRAGRRRVIEAFAPVSNGADVADAERIRILVATDVLSEGLNLQDAGDLVSFDLPWNPIRLVQRAGRIDRAGSLHGTVQIHNFLPDRGLDSILGLMDRIRSKLDAIRVAGGFDLPPLPDPADPGLSELVRRLRVGDPKLLQDLEMKAEHGFEVEEKARRIAAADAIPTEPRGPDADTAGQPGFGRPATSTTGSAGRRAVLATIDRPPGEAPAWLVVTSDGRVERFHVVRAGRVSEDREAALRILMDAASRPDSPAPPVASSAWESWRHAMELVVRQLVTCFQMGPARAGPGAGIARALLGRLGSEPGGAPMEDCERADAILARLRQGVGIGMERALDAVIRDEAGGAGSCRALLDRLEALVGDGAAGARDPPSKTVPIADRPRLLGLFRLRPGTELVLEPGPG